MDHNSKILSTKLMMSVLAIAVGGAAVIIKGDIPPGLKELLEYVLSAYVAGNVANTVVGAVQGIKVASAEAKVAVAEAVATAPAEVKEAVLPAAIDNTETLELLKANLEVSQATQKGVMAIVSRISG